MKKLGRILAVLGVIVAIVGCEPPVGPGGDGITVPVTAVSFDSSAMLNIEVGDTVTLAHTIEPSNANTGVDWESSDEDVATVSTSGLLTAVAEGSATITLSSKDDPAVSATREVNVVASGSILTLSGFSLYNQADIGDGTTTAMPELVGHKLRIVNDSTDGNLNSTTFNKHTFIYYDTELTGDFRIQARVQIHEPFGTISSNRGVTVGAYRQTAVDEFGDDTKLAAIFHRTRGDVRSYYTDNLGAKGAGSPNLPNNDENTWEVERIYEVARTGTGYSFRVLSSQDGTEIASNTIENAGLDADLVGSGPVFVGFTANGADVTFSNIKVYTGTGAEETLAVETTEVEASPVEVSGVSIDGPDVNSDATYEYQNSLETAQADTIDLDAVVVPSFADNTDVTWTSNDESVATVDAEGVVTIIGAGQATITVTTDDNGFTATYDLNISSGDVAVTSIAVSGVAEIGEGLTAVLTAQVSPSHATNQEVTWSSNNEAVATVSSTGLVTAISIGSAIITATAADGSGVTGTHDIEVVEIGDIIFSWVAGVDNAFEFSSNDAPIQVNGVTLTRDGGTTVSSESIIVTNGRFVIGTSETDNDSATATTSSRNVSDGELNLTLPVRVTLTYTDMTFPDGENTEADVRIYVNNNTTSEGNSVLYRAADGELTKISPILPAVHDAGSKTYTYDLDPDYFEFNSDSLSTAFLMLRVPSNNSVTLTSIVIEYISD